TVNYGLPEPACVSINVYDISGRMVAVLMNGYKPAGYHMTTWNANAFPTGLYMVRFTGSSRVIVRKLLLTK
ncbi:MAG: T9SS type A sorting domain-containing protein, partial [Calditrichaeota bacterium]|nr:T9SS type A sorting domain-containing protein [Calditrichota bacterium]